MPTAILVVAASQLHADPNYYRWDPSVLNNSAPLSSARGLQFGDGNVFYTNLANLITRVYKNGSVWNYENIAGINTVAPNSSFAYGDWKLYYVAADRLVHNLYKSGGVWLSPSMQPSSPQARGDALLFTTNSTVFYASTGNTICFLHWNGNSWAAINLGVYVKPNTSFAYGDYKLYFIDATGKIRNLIPSNNSYYDGGQLNSSAPLARGDGVVFGGNGELFYIDINNDITRLYWNGSGWAFETIFLRNKCVGTANMQSLVYDQGQLFYVNTHAVPSVLIKDACKWFEKPLTTVTTSAPYRLTIGAGRLFSTVTSKVNRYEATIGSGYPYVYLKGNTFYSHNGAMYPKVMNYLVDICTFDNVNFTIQPHQSFFPTNVNTFASQSLASAAMTTHLNQIAATGCNAVRVFVCAKENPQNASAAVSPTPTPTPDYRMGVTALLLPTQSGFWQPIDATFRPKLFALIKTLLDVAQSSGLKVILCTGQGGIVRPQYSANYVNYLAALAAKPSIKTHPALLAYDFFNEPGLNFDFGDKYKINALSCSMFNAVRSKDPNHLITINTFGGDDLFRWDPAIVSCDFHSFHFYPFTTYKDVSFNSELVKMFWAKENVRDRPWIIGETGFSAEEKSPTQDSCTRWPNGINGWGNEMLQKDYLVATEGWTRGCSGSGYSWWLFHDVFYYGPCDPKYEENFWGIYSNCDRPKASSLEFNKNFLDPLQYPCDNAVRPADSYYYNYDPGLGYVLSGVLLNSAGQPIKDGLIEGFDSNWGNYKWVFTRSDGSFQLCTNSPAYYIYGTAIGKEVKQYTGATNYIGASPAKLNIGNLKISDMSLCGPGGL